MFYEWDNNSFDTDDISGWTTYSSPNTCTDMEGNIYDIWTIDICVNVDPSKYPERRYDDYDDYDGVGCKAKVDWIREYRLEYSENLDELEEYNHFVEFLWNEVPGLFKSTESEKIKEDIIMTTPDNNYPSFDEIAAMGTISKAERIFNLLECGQLATPRVDSLLNSILNSLIVKKRNAFKADIVKMFSNGASPSDIHRLTKVSISDILEYVRDELNTQEQN